MRYDRRNVVSWINDMINIFLSRPNWIDKDYINGLEGFILLLSNLGMNPRTIGKTDYPNKSPMDEVVKLMEQCSGAIILGYPQIIVNSGIIKEKQIDKEFLLPTEWNHIETGLAYAREIPLLVIHHLGITRGVFDRGALSNYIYEINMADSNWPLRPDIQGALANWKKEVTKYNSNLNPISIRRITENSTLQPDNIKKVHDHIITRFCQRCGAIPGKATKCISPYDTHDFVVKSKSVYCERCGVVPGEYSECIHPYGGHRFIIS